MRQPDVRAALDKILRYEDETLKARENDPVYKDMDKTPYWDWFDVAVDWQTIKKIHLAGLLTAFGGKRKWYVLKEREAVRQILKEIELVEMCPEFRAEKVTEVPQDLFELIVGYEDIKNIFRKSIQANKPVHILLVGPPASAKSLFLMEVERISGSVFCLGGSSTKVGIRDVLFEQLPKFLLIDEIDKVNDSKDVSSLLTWMEEGRVVVTKHDQHEEKRGLGWVFAACNRKDRLPQELLSRFMVFQLMPYTTEEFLSVCREMLVKREGISVDLAAHIAQRLHLVSRDVRDAVRLARLASTNEEVDRIVEVIEKYRTGAR